ncbi:hypothetical protein LOAG_04549 [Loa loa]|uniref:CNDH2_C domain-containing protein n=1 Tax=Loa loa TaxID=7209 RepID=A0A1I7VYC1_LOALO|nr:hypothetical protein LOAG_04549 [Loa loa]EFO23936.1 hypothetical protein LOAG_04549 [Loa loa]
MTKLPEKPEPKKYAKSSDDPFGTNDAFSGKLETSEKNSADWLDVKSHSLIIDGRQANTRVISLEPGTNEVHEFDVDVLYSWDQSSGTLSYEACSPVQTDSLETFKTAKMLPNYKDIICHAKLNQRLLRDSMPSQKILSAKSLAMFNDAMRQDRLQGHLFKKIVVPCQKDKNTERYELISKICDDAISEYMASSNHGNKLLEINVECGGAMPPRISINGIRAERTIKYDSGNESYCDISQATEQVHKVKHSFQHLSTCSPALPYPSANTFSRCSIEDYVKMLKERRKIQGSNNP